MQTETTPNAAVSIAAVITHDVESYEVWKAAFDKHAPNRKAAGVVATHINRHADHPNRLSIYLAATDRSKLEGFLSSADLIATMRNAGVKGPPHIALVTPIEDLTKKDRPLAGLLVRHEVSDFAAWKKGFDGHATARASAGIVGHAVNRSVQNPNVVVIYLQAESVDALRAFTGRADLKEVMKAAGVVGAPDFTFADGGVWEN